MSEDVKDSCGCVFCDLGLPLELDETGFVHLTNSGHALQCRKPLTSDNLRPITDKGEGQ